MKFLGYFRNCNRNLIKNNLNSFPLPKIASVVNKRLYQFTAVPQIDQAAGCAGVGLQDAGAEATPS